MFRKIASRFQATRLITFNPWNCQYQVLNPKAVGEGGTEESLTKAGKELPKMSDEIKSGGDKNIKFSRTTYCILDTGTLPQVDTTANRKVKG
ncbi:MAG: hypothetical protein CM15mV24_0310 [Bellamyvirus sp.]|nr:MAG: hypothetical protein CM15mV24_0310 [Bellamyvirus sp.]